MNDEDTNTHKKRPNIIFVLADDVGWNDLGYNNPLSPVPTPEIDKLARESVVLTQHYTHSLCTPSRASLMTGRYHLNTGLTYVLAPGTPAGLPVDIPTLPILLRAEAGYRAEMTGKWHLGHAFASQTPTGRGFQRFTGIYMWDTDSYTKQMTELPWDSPLAVDWVREEVIDEGTDENRSISSLDFVRYQNVSFTHYAEPRHATEAITAEAIDAMRRHRLHQTEENSQSPLFLYIAYTAAHSPLQPLPRHSEKCTHIPHLWRREFCGVVAGLDEAIGNLTRGVEQYLGEDTILVFTTDNGGSPWFGGNNSPLRGSKATPLEGGVKTPAFVHDFSVDRRYLRTSVSELNLSPASDESLYLPRYHHGHNQRLFRGLAHMSDWLPTLLSVAQVPTTSWPTGLDGVDLWSSMQQAANELDSDSSLSRVQETDRLRSAGPRSEVLLELYDAENFVFGESLAAYRYGKYKFIDGILRDDAYYYESHRDALNCSEPSLLRTITEQCNRGIDWVFGSNKADLLRITLTHVILQDQLTRPQKLGLSPTRRLYDLSKDPTESVNLLPKLSQLPDDQQKEIESVLATIEQRLAVYKEAARKPQPAHMITPLSEWRKLTRVSGDCSVNPTIPSAECGFTHPWLKNSDAVEHWEADVFEVPGLMSITDHSVLRARDFLLKGSITLLLLSLLVTFVRLCFGKIPKPVVSDSGDKKKKKKDKESSDGKKKEE